MFSISEEPIDVEELLANVKDDSACATILFLGTIRNHNEGYVSAIYYEVYLRMAKRQWLKSKQKPSSVGT
jgi:molybdopterin synthase catalytic subunit